jgi:UDP-N-acetyl-D-mannosaminuronate dehydrogenase
VVAVLHERDLNHDTAVNRLDRPIPQGVANVAVIGTNYVAVIGTNYVGLVTATCFADLGNSVIGIDIDAKKVAQLQSGRLPIFEPGLEEIVQRNVESGRLTFTLSYLEGLASAEFAFVCVGTPFGAEVKQTCGRCGRPLKAWANLPRVSIA